MAHVRRCEHDLAHKRSKIATARAREGGADDVVAVARVAEACARLGDQRVVPEESERVGDRGEVVAVDHLGAALVVAKAGEMASEPPECDHAPMRRKVDVAIYWRIEVDAPRLGVMRQRRCRQRLRDAPDAKARLRRH
jgi:hypothetical protein